MGPSQCTPGSCITGEVSVNGLEEGLSKCLQIQDYKNKNDNRNVEKEDKPQESQEEDDDDEDEEEEEEEEEDLTAAILAQSGYKVMKNTRNKEKEQPYEEEKDELDEEDEEDITDEIVKQMGYYKDCPLHTPSSLPPDFELKSAMKGCREKQGKPPGTRSVTWAPDVRDPTPTTSEHYATSNIKKQSGESKKSGKNRQKWGGKASGEEREGKSKEKEKKRRSKLRNMVGVLEKVWARWMIVVED
ncbi:unnamed protein product [Ilex paraguariensis]|uniref:Uncharacterized protein n=1 Tax=Ilex paraguariensis TaxID=185542 RepID=A0ABC8R254_9AQUA